MNQKHLSPMVQEALLGVLVALALTFAIYGDYKGNGMTVENARVKPIRKGSRMIGTLPQPMQKGIWRHKKSEKGYEVRGVVFCATGDSWHVLYSPEVQPQVLYTREQGDFLEKFTFQRHYHSQEQGWTGSIDLPQLLKLYPIKLKKGARDGKSDN